MRTLYDTVGNAEMGKNTFYKLKLDEFNDDKRVDLARYFWKKNEEDLIMALCRGLQDKDRGRMEILRYYHAAQKYPNPITPASTSWPSRSRVIARTSHLPSTVRC